MKKISEMSASEYATIKRNAIISDYAKWFMRGVYGRKKGDENLDKWELYLKYGKK